MGFRSSPRYTGLGPRIDTRPTLYKAWAAGHRWVVYRGLLCRISAGADQPPGTMILRHKGFGECRFAGNVPMTELVSPQRPNSPLFLLNRRR